MQATNFEAEFAVANPAHGAQTLSARTGVDDFTLGSRRRFRPLLSGKDVPKNKTKQNTSGDWTIVRACSSSGIGESKQECAGQSDGVAPSYPGGGQALHLLLGETLGEVRQRKHTSSHMA